MNKVILVGRLTRDPEVKTTQSQNAVCSFTVAVDRKFKNTAGERQVDFINCVAWRQLAEFLGRYFEKGARIGIVGNLQSRSYDDTDGKKRYVTEVIVDELEFVESRRKTEPEGEGNDWVPPANTQGSFFYPDYDSEATLPFDL